MLKRYETHLHTAEGSKCGKFSAAEMTRACKSLGYDGMFVTDHFYHGNTAIDRSLPWEEWVRQFCLGYYHAKETGDQIGLNVLFGWEYSWNGCDFLTYGLSPAWLAAHPETVSLTPIEYLGLIREAGGCIVHAHPFREACYVECIKLLPDKVDAVEIYNTGNAQPAFNARARWYAEQFHLPQTAGSDTHFTNAFGGGVLLEQDLADAADYRTVVREGEIKGLIIAGEDHPFT